VYSEILQTTVSSPQDWVVEIGAGLGTLTARLANQVPDGRVIAIERDRDLVSVLRKELDPFDNIELVEANAVDYDIAGVARRRGQRIAVCGNLPYQLSGRLLFHMTDFAASIHRGVFMVQREVAERLVAPVGSKAYGALTAILNAFSNVEIITHVSPGAFFPMPSVQSSVIALDFFTVGNRPVSLPEPEQYIRVVKAAFSQRRKTLRNALTGAFAPDSVMQAGITTSIDLGRRGETLDVGEFAALAAALPTESGAVSA